MAIQLRDATPLIPAASQDENRLPPQYTNHRFEYIHYPGGWSWVEGIGFLPDLSRVVAMPGVNGVTKDGKASKALSGSIDKGGLRISPTDPRLGKWAPYIGNYLTRSGGRHWCFIKQTFTILPGGAVREDDRSAEFNEFRAHLMAAGVCYPMEEVVFNQCIEIENRGIERLARDAEKNPYRKAAYEARVAKRAAMLKWWADRNGVTDPNATQTLTPVAAELDSEAFDVPATAPKPRRKVEVSA